MRDDRSDAARSRGVSVGLAGVAFVADDGAGLNVGSDVEQGLEVTRVGSFAAGQVEGDDVAGGVRFCVDFLVKPPRERRGFGGEATIDPLKASKRKTKKA